MRYPLALYRPGYIWDEEPAIAHDEAAEANLREQGFRMLAEWLTHEKEEVSEVQEVKKRGRPRKVTE